MGLFVRPVARGCWLLVLLAVVFVPWALFNSEWADAGGGLLAGVIFYVIGWALFWVAKRLDRMQFADETYPSQRADLDNHR